MSDLKRWDYELHTGMWALDTGDWVLFEDAEAAIKATIREVLPYTEHKLGCHSNSFPKKISEFEIERRPCTCGLEAIRARGKEPEYELVST